MDSTMIDDKHLKVYLYLENELAIVINFKVSQSYNQMPVLRLEINSSHSSFNRGAKDN